jgi:hypothetical protein
MSSLFATAGSAASHDDDRHPDTAADTRRVKRSYHRGAADNKVADEVRAANMSTLQTPLHISDTVKMRLHDTSRTEMKQLQARLWTRICDTLPPSKAMQRDLVLWRLMPTGAIYVQDTDETLGDFPNAHCTSALAKHRYQTYHTLLAHAAWPEVAWNFVGADTISRTPADAAKKHAARLLRHIATRPAPTQRKFARHVEYWQALCNADADTGPFGLRVVDDDLWFPHDIPTSADVLYNEDTDRYIRFARLVQSADTRLLPTILSARVIPTQDPAKEPDWSIYRVCYHLLTAAEAREFADIIDCIPQ